MNHTRYEFPLIGIAALLLLIALIITGSPEFSLPGEHSYRIRILHPPSGAEAILSGQLIDLNCAKPLDLEAFPGIGPVLAQRIVKYRLQNGPFRTVAALRKVRGVGSRLLRRISPLLHIGSAPCPEPSTTSRLPVVSRSALDLD